MLRTILKKRTSGRWAAALALLAFITLLTLPVSAVPYHHGQKLHKQTLHGRTLHSRRHPVHYKRRHRKVKTAHKPTIHPVILPDQTISAPHPITDPNTSHGIPPKGGN